MTIKLTDLFPFELAQGDTLRRTNPSGNLNLNSNTTWLVSQEERMAHKMRAVCEELNALPAKLEAMQSVINQMAEVLEGVKPQEGFTKDVWDAYDGLCDGVSEALELAKPYRE